MLFKIHYTPGMGKTINYSYICNVYLIEIGPSALPNRESIPGPETFPYRTIQQGVV